MLNLDEINKEIKALEDSGCTSYSVCQKLAILYIVRDHNTPKEETPISVINKSAVIE